MSAVLDVKQLAQTRLTPKPASASRDTDAVTERTAAKLASLEPAVGDDAEVPEPVLCLTPQDIERLQQLGEVVSAARAAMQKAEADLAAATTQARQLVELERRAGALAADAFRGREAAKQAARAIAADIEDCKLTAAALPALTRDAETARNAFHGARGVLHGAATTAIQAAMLRASKRYAVLALEITEALAAIDAGLAALPSHMGTPLICGWHVHVMAGVSLPALPDTLRVNNMAVASINFRDSLLGADHPRLSAHRTHAATRLQAQLREALAPSGFDPSRLLA